MKARIPLFTKVLFLSFLNLCLICLAIVLVVRVQFRTDARWFLIAPAQDRIMAVAHRLALDLDETPSNNWDALLTRYAQVNGAGFYLFDERGDKLAGPEVRLPRDVAERIPRRGGRRREDSPAQPEKGRERRQPPPPLFLLATDEPAGYWAGVRVPLRREPAENPKPGTLVLMTPSVWQGNLFFDVKSWLTVALAIVLVSVAVWLPFIRGMTRSIRQMTRTTERIAEGRFEIHVADERRDEIGQLGEAINRMASRLQGFVNGQKRFLSGIGHELCTPIATMQFGLGNLERRVDDRHRDAVVDLQEEIQHMSSLVNELLSFSRSGMESRDIKLVKVNVAATVERVLDREASSETKVEVAVDENVNVAADGEYLFRALSNVVRNAIRYAGHAGPIRVTARVRENQVSITVVDCGPGVPEHATEEIFTPFYRLDLSRSQETGGLGLGLAIVKTCVEACGGTVSCSNVQPSGLAVEIRLPAASEL